MTATTPDRCTSYTHEQWLEARKLGIGSSDVPAILGVCSPSQGTPYSVWCEKRGEYHEDLEGIEHIEAGQFLEQGIADWFAHRTGRRVVHPLDYAHQAHQVGRKVLWQHPEHAYMQATPDFFQLDVENQEGDRFEKKGPGVLECKNVGFFMRSDWDHKTGKVPLRVMAQLQYQLEVTGLEWGSAAGLIGGNSLVWVDVERNERFIGALRTKLDAFWRSVEKGNPPGLDGAEKTWKAIKARWSEEDPGRARAVPASLIEEFNRGGAMEREGKELKAKARNALCEHLKDSTYGMIDGVNVCQWKEQNQAVMGKVGNRLARVFRVLGDARNMR